MKAHLAQSHLQTIQRALQQQNLPKAQKHLRKCADNPPNEVNLLLHLLKIAQQLHAPDMSLKLLQKAEQVTQSNPQQLMLIVGDYLELQAYEHATRLLQKIAKSFPQTPEVYFKLGWVANMQMQFEQAITHFKQQLSLTPEHEMSAYLLARTYERCNELELADETVKESLTHLADSPVMRGMQAKLQYRRGELDTAREILDEVTSQVADDHIRMEYYTLLGKLYDKQHNSAAAFRAFTASNEIARENALRHYNLAQYRKEIEIKTAMLTPEWIESWPAHATAEQQASYPYPVFLIGFPRSGTTLLDQILSTHPQVTVMEEVECLSEVAAELPGDVSAYQQALATMSESQRAQLQKRYFRAVKEKFGKLPQDGLLIDKLPLNLTKIDIIQRVFPGAKIILAARHPCDAIFSAFMQSFEMNPAMAHMTSLQDATLFYGALFTYWRRAVELLPLNSHMVKYESLVADFDKEARQLTDFLELEWDDSLTRFHEFAAQRGFINTPSYTEVIKPINNSAIGRWQRYRSYLDSCLPTLQPHAEYLGYEL